MNPIFIDILPFLTNFCLQKPPKWVHPVNFRLEPRKTQQTGVETGRDLTGQAASGRPPLPRRQDAAAPFPIPTRQDSRTRNAPHPSL